MGGPRTPITCLTLYSLTMSNLTLGNLTVGLNATSPGSSSGRPPWYQYNVCAVAPYGFIFYFGVKVLNLAVGFPTNMLVMWMVATRKTEGSTSDIFIFNLAVLDAYFCLMTPIDMVNRLILNNQNIWHFQLFAYGVKDTAPLFLTCICLDRYVAVVHPILFTGIRDNRIRAAVTVLVWGLILAYALTKSLLGVRSTTEYFSGLILFSFTVMLFCNVSIIWVLRKSVAGKETMNPVKKKAFRMVMIVMGIIIGNYLPPVATMPFVAYYTFVAFRCQISISVFSIMDLSCSIEPLLYISKMEKPSCCGRFQNPQKKPTEVPA
ncbi:P2Y purinoceptor 1 [Alosa alosa]|uniref:P2Y purinoceptor 1 n=1 Tax=Alosa alosa TaxID=278164 RepID=UPI0020151F5D|nr:P2Y purinoceptor 1 [Alosa alosa]